MAPLAGWRREVHTGGGEEAGWRCTPGNIGCCGMQEGGAGCLDTAKPE